MEASWPYTLAFTLTSQVKSALSFMDPEFSGGMDAFVGGKSPVQSSASPDWAEEV